MLKVEFKLKYDIQNIGLGLNVKTEKYKAIELKNSLEGFDLEKFVEFSKDAAADAEKDADDPNVMNKITR